MTRPHIDELLSKLPDGVTVQIRGPRDASDSSPPRNVNQQPVLNAVSAVSGDVVDSASAYTETVLTSSAGLVDPQAANKTIASQSQVTDLPRNMESCPTEALISSDSWDMMMNASVCDLASGLDYNPVGLEIEDVVVSSFACPAVSDAWSGGMAPNNFQLSLQNDGMLFPCWYKHYSSLGLRSSMKTIVQLLTSCISPREPR